SSADTQNLTNDEMLANTRQYIDQINQVGSLIDFQEKIIAQDANAKLNVEFPKVIKIEYQGIKTSSKEILVQATSYMIKLNDTYWLNVDLAVFNKDKKAYQSEVADFNKIIQSLTLKPALDSDNDGLSDAEEAKLGTNLNNPDTDGDGYLDGSEVINGFNPLGK
ncbi:MAG TPA: thrombospondin type 3 repeat-containing protein, partial [Candidatus Methylomirabilis sp.]|nr:thrombospondin type 3 repeat-containing protein [Candidatus Methylomirabilis sp.]